MLGTFLTEEPTSVPDSVAAFVAGQLGEDAEHFAGNDLNGRRSLVASNMKSNAQTWLGRSALSRLAG
jgi:hypothetical protein